MTHVTYRPRGARCADRPAGTDGPVVKVLVLTTFDDDDAVSGALLAGATGYLLEQAAPRDLAAAVRAVAGGDAWIDPHVAGRVVKALAAVPRVADRVPELLARLTPREREVLVLMAEGLSNAEIARLVVGVGTVKTHVSRTLMKTATRDRAQAIALAYRCGLVVPARGGRPASGSASAAAPTPPGRPSRRARTCRSPTRAVRW